MAKNIAVYGIYPNRLMVEKAVEELKDAGFRHSDISVLFPAGGDTREFAVEKETKAPEGAVAGAGTGAVVGGTLGWLVGIGSLAIPGLGPFIAAGPIMAALAGAGAGGLAGGIAGALIGMGIPEYEANRYEGRVKDGGILLSVHADDSEWKKKGKDVLERTGAEDISTKGESSADYDESDNAYSYESDDAYSDETSDPMISNTRDPIHAYPNETSDPLTSDTINPIRAHPKEISDPLNSDTKGPYRNK